MKKKLILQGIDHNSNTLSHVTIQHASEHSQNSFLSMDSNSTSEDTTTVAKRSRVSLEQLKQYLERVPQIYEKGMSANTNNESSSSTSNEASVKEADVVWIRDSNLLNSRHVGRRDV